ncbi:MAG TPA: acyltransferase [Terriglobales bacterium]|nr:acyltransferase [Terriglobales bacterium]
MRRIEELDGLRAIAIFGVFAVHFRPFYSHAFDLLGLGWTGVDLFFGISGFLITTILIGLRGHQAPYKTFYWRRTLRIFPPYYVVLALLLFSSLLHKENVAYGQTIRDSLFLSSAHPKLVKLAFQRLLHGNLSYWPQPLQPLIEQYYLPKFWPCHAAFWSLSVEELFYLLWAPVILKGSRRIVLFCSIVPLVICPILRGLAHGPSLDEASGFLFRFDSLAAGGCVALLFLAKGSGRLNNRILERGLVLTIIFSSLVFVGLSWYCGAFRGVEVRTRWVFSVFGFTSLSLLCASVVGACVRWSGSLSIVFRALRSRLVVYLGAISYVMYLTYLPVYVLIQLIFLNLLGKSNGPEMLQTNTGLVLLQGVLAVLCTIGLASLSWRYFEIPILRLKDRRFPASAAGGSERPNKWNLSLIIMNNTAK